MRVRLQSLPPLVPLKAWYEIPPLLLSGSSTIEHIKHELCNKFLKQPSQEFSTGNITIELENYEILNDCAVTVLRENDLLVYVYRSVTFSWPLTSLQDQIQTVGTSRLKTQAMQWYVMK